MSIYNKIKLGFNEISLFIYFVVLVIYNHLEIREKNKRNKMIYLKTFLKVIDNSGAELVECIKVLRKSPMNCAHVGDKIVVVVQEAKPLSSQITGASASNRVKRGDICRAVVVRTKYPIQREDGTVIRFDDNACVLINQKDEPIGTRVSSVVARELRKKNFAKVISLAPRVV